MKANASLLLLALFTTTAVACGNRLLVGNDPDAGGPPTIPTGTAGSTGAGVMGEPTGGAGTGNPTGTAGSSGTAGSTGAGLMGEPTGGAGTGSTGFAGTQGPGPASGSAGSGGAATATRIVTPLLITGEQALRRLAKLLWNAEPSEDLLSQARLGHFTTTDDLYGAARQMLADPQARTGIGAFYRQWLQLSRTSSIAKDPQLFPLFSPMVASDMAAETEAFAVNVTLAPGGTFTDLMTAPYSYINERLAPIYGLGGISGFDLQKVALDPKQRAGLVTQPALQAINSFDKRNSPSKRGSYMLQTFECTAVPPPPPNFPGALDPLPPNTTVRQALAMSASQAACAACHGQIDPPGLPFEAFDAIGRWRTTDNGFPVDLSNIFIQNLDDSGPIKVDGPVAFASVLARSPRVQECMARWWLFYGTGMTLNQLNELDDRDVQNVTAVFRASGLDLKELIATALTNELVMAPRP